MNRKGYIKVVEAVLAVLIVVSALILVSVQRQNAIESQVSVELSEIIDRMARDNPIREEIIADDGDSSTAEDSVRDYFLERLGERFNVVVLICSLNETCQSEEEMGGGEVYSVERVVTTSVSSTNFNPKRVRVFVWRR